ncbi:peptidoglycan-binding domain-containing protein [Haloplanus halophilus]|uniref:peptidoglycan-binding domain-containing protein n=1 Tax=Haloplanus halophilus TaxID=2949993 RepID=UPI00203FD9A9|nr:peptidoglycan-binding domain-containing protein [Haloplanus sp. GDY1]
MYVALGAEGEEVRELQDRLAERGYDVGAVDGRFGRRTRAAVAELQRERGLTASGAVTPEIAEELGLEIDVPEIEEARSKFRQFVTKNPNYFGNQPELDFEPVTEKITDTSYEEVTCVGYDPGSSQLEAVVSVERDVGYGGDVCTDGSIEYVRFFLDRDRNGQWENVGVASTRVYDMPGRKPVDYAVSVDLDQELETCDSPVLPRVRAILSWETEPPADETYRPVWGNRHEADVQLEAREPTAGDLMDPELVSPELLSGLDLAASMPFDPPEMAPSQLLTKYRGTSVPPHRAGFGEFKRLLSGPLPMPAGPSGPDGPSPGPFPGPLPEPFPEPDPQFDLPAELDVDVEDLIDDLSETAGNTSYEELDCVGFRRGILTGLLTIKRPAGYGGGLCTAGSPEYVAFWEKPVSGGAWTHLGTGSVTVHDVPGLPADGLQYAVHLPADLSHHRTPCEEGPSLVKVRAVLAWNRRPPSTDPNFTPTWGNRVETVIQVAPGPDPGEGLLEVGTLGNVIPTDIEQTPGSDATGTATGPLVSSGGSVRATAAAFGGRVTITGRPEGISPSAGGPNGLKYRVSVKPHGAPTSAYRPLTNEFQVATYENPGTFQSVTVDGDGFYTYVPGAKQNLLALWHTSDDGVYDLKVEAKRGDGQPVDAAAVTYPDGTTESELVIQLDNTAPDAEIDITEVVPGGSGDAEPAAECDFFNIGDTIRGTFTADDEHFRTGPTPWAPYRFVVRPGGPASGARPRERPPAGPGTVRARGGGDGDWELETSGMQSCGYVVALDVADNVIVNNNYSGHRRGDSEGFCLLEAGEEVVDGSSD